MLWLSVLLNMFVHGDAWSLGVARYIVLGLSVKRLFGTKKPTVLRRTCSLSPSLGSTCNGYTRFYYLLFFIFLSIINVHRRQQLEYS